MSSPSHQGSHASVVHIIDDDASIRLVLKRLLHPLHWPVETFESADQFIAATEAEAKGCIVMDVHLDGKNGVELVADFRARGYQHPVIFITGYPDVHTGITAMKLGAVDFLMKPVEESALLDALERAEAFDEISRRASLERRELERRLRTLTPRERQVLSLVVTGLLNKHQPTEDYL